MSTIYNAGIDEAGRGPVLGPLVIAIVVLNPQEAEQLQNSGVTDSKKLSEKKRTELVPHILAHSTHADTQIIDAHNIDTYLSSGTNLNMVEAIHSAKLCDSIPQAVQAHTRLMIDLPSKNKAQYLGAITKHSSCITKLARVDAEFKADVNHIAVSAASILAKVTRDTIIKELAEKIGLPLGSGYPSDPLTKAFIEKYATTYPHICRQSWESIKRLHRTNSQQTLSDL